MSVNTWQSTNTWGASSPNNYTLTLDSGSYSLSGDTLTLKQDVKSLIESGDYIYTGTPINFAQSGQNPVNHVMSLDSGGYNLTGDDLTLSLDSQISTETGNYSSIFNSINLPAESGIIINNGHYNYTGSIINMNYSGEVIQRIDFYTVRYASDIVSMTYKD